MLRQRRVNSPEHSHIYDRQQVHGIWDEAGILLSHPCKWKGSECRQKSCVCDTQTKYAKMCNSKRKKRVLTEQQQKKHFRHFLLFCHKAPWRHKWNTHTRTHTQSMKLQSVAEGNRCLQSCLGGSFSWFTDGGHLWHVLSKTPSFHHRQEI